MSQNGRCTRAQRVFFSELQEGKRDHGAPRKHYRDQLERQLAQAGISHQSWQQGASDRNSWHSSVRKANREFEVEGCKAARKDVGGRQSEQHPSHPHPNCRLSKVQ